MPPMKENEHAGFGHRESRGSLRASGPRQAFGWTVLVRRPIDSLPVCFYNTALLREAVKFHTPVDVRNVPHGEKAFNSLRRKGFPSNEHGLDHRRRRCRECRDP